MFKGSSLPADFQWAGRYDNNLLVIGVRTCVFMYMVAVTALFGWATYYFLSQNEFQLRETSYEGVALDLGASVQTGLEHNFQASLLMAEIAGAACPAADQWPNCSGFSLQQYLRYGDNFKGFAPQLNFLSIITIVAPDEALGFESFANSYYTSQGHGENDPVPFGYTDSVFGIKKLNETTGVLETSRVPYADGEYSILTPVLYSTASASSMLFNIYSEPLRVSAVDEMFNCVTATETAVGKKKDCGVVTDMLGEVSTFFAPIFPAEDNTTLVGFTSSFFEWKQMLAGHLAPNSRPVVAVVTSGTQSLSFEVGGGSNAVTFLGTGDSHDSELEDYVQVFSLTDTSDLSPLVYSMSVYPTSGFTDPTGFPTMGGFVAATVIVVTGLVVLAYDQVVSRKAREQKIVDETKRLFVRYISHEIRTPLNTVHLGLVYLKADIAGLVDEIRLMVPAAALDQISSWVGLLEEIEDSGDIAVNVLDDLINYDKIVMGSLNLEVSEVPIVKCIQTNFRSFGLPAREREINLKLKLLQPVKQLANLICVGDSVKLEMVIRNLVSNAIKFTSAGGSVAVTVSLDESPIHSHEPFELQHLGRNATAGGENKICIDYSALEFRGWLILSVSDSGIGMTQANLADLFNEGVQFNANQLQQGKGSGLGLWVSKGFVERHGGEIAASSDGIGCGTTFTVRLPAYVNLANRYRRSSDSSSSVNNADVESGSGGGSVNSVRSSPDPTPNPNSCSEVQASEPPLVAAAGGAAAAPAIAALTSTPAVTTAVTELADASPNMRFKNVLLVDDSIPNRKMLDRLLTRANVGVCTHAGDGAAAVKIVSSNPTKFDLILMDFEMPIMDGPTATRAIRELGVTCLIIGITGNVLPTDTSIFLTAGANRVLSKPVTMPLLHATFDELGADNN